MKVVLCCPCLTTPMKPFMNSLKKSVPIVKEAGWEVGWENEVGNPYISAARSIMTRKALDSGADVIIYLDYDLSWNKIALLTLLQTKGEVVAGTYRFKQEEEKYMGALLSNNRGTPLLREDGMIYADRVPAGFLKVTRKAIFKFMESYPNLIYGDKWNPSIDLFNHGAHNGIWYGEDYAFSRNWIDCGGELIIVPNLNINHHSQDSVYKGNQHLFLMKQPGGKNYVPPIQT